MNILGSFYGNRYLFSLFVVTLCIYLAINLTLSWFARWLARRTASGGTRAKRGTKLDRPHRSRCAARGRGQGRPPRSTTALSGSGRSGAEATVRRR